MNQPVPWRKVFDCFLYNGEIYALEIRLHELANVVDRFIVVESDTTFGGLGKALSFDPLDPRITRFAARIRYVTVKDMPQTQDRRQREAWQRNAILRGVPDANDDDLILMSDVDEIPRATVVREMIRDTADRVFGLQFTLFSRFVDRRSTDAINPAVITGSIAAKRAEFDKTKPGDMWHAIRNGLLPVRVISSAGWHFSSLGNKLEYPDRIAGLSRHNSKRSSFSGLTKAQDDLKRPEGGAWEIVDCAELPKWLQVNRRKLSRLFYPRTTVGRLLRRLESRFARSRRRSIRTTAKSPVIICPYLHAHEADEIALKFGLREPHGRKLDFFLWQDSNGLGPERAYQHCWDQFPDRDVIILHSDMSPTPNDRFNRWYDLLLEYRRKLPRAGMLACNLLYPVARMGQSRRVQCAGGTFREGKIGHLTGDGVSAETLRRVRRVDWVTFGGVLIRRELIQACGAFDDRYRWAYVMDVDYCFEARLRGFGLFQVPVALQHEENRTTRELWEANPRLYEHISDNYELFYEKWRAFGAALPSIG